MLRPLLAAALTLSAAADVRHVVCFKFTDKATADQKTMVEKAFAELPAKIEIIRDFEWGTNVSKEGHDKGFTHCFVLTFDDQADLEAYLPHPAHKEFVSKLDGLIDDVFVIDYVTK